MSDNEKGEWKTVKFIKYEAVKTEGNKEFGIITYEYKENGNGEYVDESEEIIFIKIDGKWYVNESVF